MSPEENDPAWKLLGQLEETEVDPFFSRNVLREVRQLPSKNSGLAGLLGRFFSPSLALPISAAAALAGGLFLLHDSPTPSSEVNAVITEVTEDQANQQTIASSDSANASDTLGVESAELIALEEEIDEFTAIEGLGELAAMQDVAMLSDEDISRLLF